MARSGSFTGKIDDFSIQFMKGSEATVRSTAGLLFGAIIKSTPVDEGRARANWFATGQSPSSSVTDKEDHSKDGKTTANKAELVVSKLKGWDSFILTNNLPYIGVLEYGGYPDPVKLGTNISKAGEDPVYEKRSKSGYSKQAPSGMVRVNVLKFNRLIALQAKKLLPK